MRQHLGTIRGRLVIWYLAVLAAVLLALGIFQSVTLTDYLRSSTARSIRTSAFTELRILGPCFIRSSAQLESNAQKVAGLLGSRGTAVKIVTGSGKTLADHGFGEPGAFRPLVIPESTIHTLIASARPDEDVPAPVQSPPCHDIGTGPHTLPRPPEAGIGGGRSGTLGRYATLNSGDLVLVAVPLGPGWHPVGYALLAQSFSDASSTIRRTDGVFAAGAAAALVLAGLVALPIINRALRPLRRITAVAERIARGDLGQRADLPNSPDEIGRLGQVFDAMVERLSSAIASANASEERMRRFLGDASHELRTPLTVLRGMSEVLLRQGTDTSPDHMAALVDMHDEAVRLSRLVEDLLTLTRLDTGTGLEPEAVSVRSAVEQFVDRYSTAWPERQIDTSLDALDGAAAWVDPDALRRMLTNLVDNAARYSRAGGAIVLSGAAAEKTVTVTVADEGPGLSQDDARRVFERFYRAARSRSRRTGGTGLGLAIVQALAQGSGGTASMDSAPDRGTAVTVTLPRAQTE